MHLEQGNQAQTCPATQSKQKVSSPIVPEWQDDLTMESNGQEQCQQHWTGSLHCHLLLQGR